MSLSHPPKNADKRLTMAQPLSDGPSGKVEQIVKLEILEQDSTKGLGEKKKSFETSHGKAPCGCCFPKIGVDPLPPKMDGENFMESPIKIGKPYVFNG